jgi:YfiR/HmsC-like
MTLRMFTAAAIAMLLATSAPAQEVEEYQVKAAFLYNFAKFVEWPAQTFKTPQDPIMVCVLGHNPFGNALEDVMRGKSIEGRAFAFRQVSNFEEASSCQILFISSSEGKHFHALYGNANPARILTVGEAQGFASAGGVINFKLDEGHVHFEINVGAAEHAQLQISSKLLSLAQIVKTEKIR